LRKSRSMAEGFESTADDFKRCISAFCCHLSWSESTCLILQPYLFLHSESVIKTFNLRSNVQELIFSCLQSRVTSTSCLVLFDSFPCTRANRLEQE
jgi:hypothetical protein